MGNKASSGLPKGITQRNTLPGYKVFTDIAVDSYSFGSSGHDTVNWFLQNSNYNDIISRMTPTQIDAFQRYTEGHFMNGQQYLGFSQMSQQDQRLTKIYDKVLDKSILYNGIQVVRNSTGELLGTTSFELSSNPAKIAELVGKDYYIAANLSTSAAAAGLNIGSLSKDFVYKLSIPGGTKGAGMWIGDPRINGWGSEQREFITNRDIVVRCNSITYDTKSGKYVVDLAYVTNEKHKYT